MQGADQAELTDQACSYAHGRHQREAADQPDAGDDQRGETGIESRSIGSAARATECAAPSADVVFSGDGVASGAPAAPGGWRSEDRRHAGALVSRLGRACRRDPRFQSRVLVAPNNVVAMTAGMAQPQAAFPPPTGLDVLPAGGWRLALGRRQ